MVGVRQTSQTRSLQRRASTPAVTLLERSGVRYTLHPYEHNPTVRSYGMEAAEALGVAAWTSSWLPPTSSGSQRRRRLASLAPAESGVPRFAVVEKRGDEQGTDDGGDRPDQQ